MIPCPQNNVCDFFVQKIIGIFSLVEVQVIQISAEVRTDILWLVLCSVMFRTGFKADESTGGRLKEETYLASFCCSDEMTLVIPPRLQRL